MATRVRYGNDSRLAILRGVNLLADTVKITLGPKGRTVLISQPSGSPIVTKDGVTVAKQFELKDNLENLGAKMVRDVASRTNEMVGDGTTTATVLARAIYREGVRNVAAGTNPTALKRGIDRAVAAICGSVDDRASGYLCNLARPVTAELIAHVGTISANNDATIGRIVAEAMKKVGADGVISVEESQSAETSLECDRMELRTESTSAGKPNIFRSLNGQLHSYLDVRRPLSVSVHSAS